MKSAAVEPLSLLPDDERKEIEEALIAYQKKLVEKESKAILASAAHAYRERELTVRRILARLNRA